MRDTGPLANLKRHCTIFSPTKEHINRWTIRAALFLQHTLASLLGFVCDLEQQDQKGALVVADAAQAVEASAWVTAASVRSAAATAWDTAASARADYKK